MKTLLLSLMLSSGTLFAQSLPNSQPLSPEERRLVLGQLLELKACRETISTYDKYIIRDIEQDAREKANFERSIELERQAAEIARKERDLAIDKANLYEQMYRSLAKKPGIGCFFKKLFTLWVARC